MFAGLGLTFIVTIVNISLTRFKLQITQVAI